MIHVNFSFSNEEKWDRVMRKLQRMFPHSIVYGNFFDSDLPTGEIMNKLFNEGFSCNLTKHPAYDSWIQIYL